MARDDNDNNRNPHRPFWEKVCEELKDALKAKALRLANGRVEDAEDLVQGTVCRILMYPRNPQKIGSPLRYLFRVMRNLWIDGERKERRKKTDSLDELRSRETEQNHRRSVEPTVEPTALRMLENNEFRDKLRAKQGPLTTREKLLLALYLRGYSRKEIADMLNEDVRLIRSDLNAVIAKVRGRLKG